MPVLPLVTLARLAFVVAAVGYLLFAPGLVMLYGVPLALDPVVGATAGPVSAGLLGVVVAAACAAIGLLNLVVAVGLGWRNRWWWGAGVFLGLVYTPTGCLPIGLLVLVALLGRDARLAYGVTPTPEDG